MQVRDIMRREVRTCAPDTTLAEAGRLMAEIAGGVLPVVAGRRKLLGVITDRDICLAVAQEDRAPSQLRVANFMSAPAFGVPAEEEIGKALETMRWAKVRRLPVVSDDDTLEGLLSLDDVVLHVDVEKDGSHPVSALDVALTLRAACDHALPALLEAGLSAAEPPRPDADWSYVSDEREPLATIS